MSRRRALLFFFCSLSALTAGPLAAQQQDGNRITIAPAERLLVLERMTATVIPRVDFKDATLGEAMDFVRMIGSDFDRMPNAPKPFGIVLVDPGLDQRKIKSMFLKNINLHDFLNQCAALTGTCVYVSNNLIEFHDGDRLDLKRRALPAGRATEAARARILNLES